MNVTLLLTTTDYLSKVIEAERDVNNARYVYQWSLSEHMEALDNPNIRHYIVLLENEFVGYVILDNVEDYSYSINLRRIVITKKNLGIGKIVIEKVKDIAFNQLNAHRLWLDVFTDNIKAYNLYKKCNFREEGKLIESYLREDGFASQFIMAILKRDYYLE